MAEISTDNKNRTAAEIRHILTKNGGSIASAGAVSRLFHRKGQIMIARSDAEEERVMEIALEAGAEDFLSDPEGYEIITDPNLFEEVLNKMEAASIPTLSAGVTCLAELTTPVDPASIETIQKLVDKLEDHDDVTNLYTNADFPE